MGGKNKQAQRTKNNAKPSSSGRSAEMLASTIPHFATFQASKDANYTLPGFALAGIDDMDSSVDSNFQLVLRKMNKKDSTTKLKALQEFSDLIKVSDPEAVKAVLAFWPRIYNTLATDTDHRVREAVHEAHYEVVIKAKRNLAPFLKPLIAPWFTSQYDTYPPAASTATKAFEAAFPGSKSNDAILFCQEEILTYINENLVSHSANTISNPKTTSPEEADAKYERVIISSLQGYSLYLNKVSTDGIKKCLELNLKIVEDKKFWKLAKHPVTKIRSAWYGSLAALCQKASFILEKQQSNLCTSVFNNLDEAEPAVLTLVWETALLTITTIEKWWEFINIEKTFLPKLWKVLKNGGLGNASIIYPNLLPLISHLSSRVEDVNDFYFKFFDHLRAGLKNKNVLSSRSELNSVLTAIMECLQFVILTQQNDNALCEKLIKTQLFPLLEWCFKEAQSPHKNIFNHVAAMIQHWSRNCADSNVNNYCRYLEYFWRNLCSMFEGLFMNLEQNYKEDDVDNFAVKSVDFLMYLKSCVKIKKQQKVQFSYEIPDASLNKTEDDNGKEDALSSAYMESLHSLVYETCGLYINFINSRTSKQLLPYLNSIIKNFESADFFRFLNHKVSGESDSPNLMQIYYNLISKWLNSPSLVSESVIDLLFLLFKYLQDEDKDHVLKDLVALDKNNFRTSISHMLNTPYNEDKIVKNWLNKEVIAIQFVNIVEEILDDSCSPESVLLLKKVFTEINGELVINQTTVLSIIKTFCKALHCPEEYLITIDTCASLAAYISDMIYTDSLNLTYGDDLILAFFTFSCNYSIINSEYLSEDTLWEINTSWQDAFLAICATSDNKSIESLTTKLAAILEKQFLLLDMNDINYEHLVKVLTNFARCVQKSKPFLLNKLLTQFFERPNIKKWKQQVLNLAINGEYVRGNLSCPYESVNITETGIVDDNVIKYFIWTHLVINVINATIEDITEDALSDEEDFEITTFIQILDNSETILLDAVYDICLINSLRGDYKNTKFFKLLRNEVDGMKKKIKGIFNSADDELRNKIVATTIQRHNSHKWIWAHVLRLISADLIVQGDLSVFYETVYKQLTDNLAKLHLLQAFSNVLSYDNVFSSSSVVDNIITLRCLINCDEIEVQIAETYAQIHKLKTDDLKQHYSNVNLANWSNCQVVIEALRFFSSIIKSKPDHVDSKLWDLIVVSLSSWSNRANQLKSSYKSVQGAAFIAAVSDLFTNVVLHVEKLRETDPTSDHVDEWDNLFAQNIHTDIVHVWLYMIEEYHAHVPISLIQVPFLKAFGGCILNIKATYIFNNPADNLPNWSKIIKRCCVLLLHKDAIMQIWGYHMLVVMIPELISVDKLSIETNTPHAKGLIVEKFRPLLSQTQEIVQAMFLDFKLVESSCRVETFTDSYTYTFAYLLTWDVILALCEQSSTEVCYQYADWLRKEDFLTNMLNNIFKLMPAEVLHDECKIKAFQDCFLKKCPLSLEEETSSEKLEQLACWIYAATVFQLPACVRQWWSAVDTKTAQVVERVTSTFVSPQLSLQELQDVATHENKFKNMTIKVHPSVREVIAVYTVDEAQMELVITLPANYPLGSPDVQCNRQIGGTSHKQWLMQLRKCVLHQNGRIWDGLSLWNNNLDKKFDGVEECYICFAILHPGTYQLPKLSCQTCRKKFHSACLYKWFSTSNKSTCPICRNLF